MKKNHNINPVVIDRNIAQLLKQPVGATREFTLDEDIHAIDAALEPTERLIGTVKVMRTKRGALVSLKAKTSLRVPCSRCLEPVIVPVVLDFQEEFLQTIDIVTGLPLDVSHDDPGILIDEHHDLQLAAVIREYLLIALPMQPLCREDCKGLCPQCGQNLNLGPCRCVTFGGDERWAALRSLLTS